MWSEAVNLISGWQPGDTKVVIAGALAAMACALPGNFLLIRRQSMMGDAISHTVLPGIVLAFLAAHGLKQAGWLPADSFDFWLHAALFLGAVLLGVLCAVMTEWVRWLGQVESSAALGVVFTSLFALGLLLIRMKADDVHLDPDCVLLGSLEAVFLSNDSTPRAFWVNGLSLALNLVLLVVFFKELRLSSFDSLYATSLGYHASTLNYGLMAITAATLVAAFETVGSILVIAMLVAPPATAYLLTDRFWLMILLSLIIAALTALLGRAAAIVLPSLIFSRLGYPMIDTASTSGMMAVMAGALLVLAVFVGPRYGLISKLVNRFRLALDIAAQDVLGQLFRREEESRQRGAVRRRMTFEQLLRGQVQGSLPLWIALRILLGRGQVDTAAGGFGLSESGRTAAAELVRSHRLFESYMAKHFELPADHLHDTAERVEHFLDPQLREMLSDELDSPATDPHGRSIPDSGESEESPSED